jgi:hypothetical protein
VPNWCDNYVTFKHDDPAMIDRVIRGFTGEGLFTEFAPCPQELIDTLAGSFGDPDKNAELEQKQKTNMAKYGAKDWYDWCNQQWGTKWDVDTRPSETTSKVVKRSEAGTEVALGFSTAWSPPTGFYATMVDEFGFKVSAYYYECGCAFCGYWSSDGDDDTYEITGDSAWVRNHIPSAIDEHFAISENMEMWEEENNESTKENA